MSGTISSRIRLRKLLSTSVSGLLTAGWTSSRRRSAIMVWNETAMLTQLSVLFRAYTMASDYADSHHKNPDALGNPGFWIVDLKRIAR